MAPYLQKKRGYTTVHLPDARVEQANDHAAGRLKPLHVCIYSPAAVRSITYDTTYIVINIYRSGTQEPFYSEDWVGGLSSRLQ